MNRIPLILLLIGILASLDGTASAQPDLRETPSLEQSYALEIRVLTGPDASSRVRAQQWSRAFEQLGRGVTLATDNGREDTGVQFIDSRRTKTLRVVGILDRRGDLRFENRAFRLTDDKPLSEYFDGLARFGPGGPLRERSTWGLTNDQFEDVVRQFAAPCDRIIEATSAVDLVRGFEFPQEFQVTWSKAALKSANALQKDAWSLDFKSLSSGTALAVGLAQFGLGFRPLAHPDGGILIEIDTGGEDANLWPIGWKNTGPMNQAVPLAFKLIAVDLEDVEVDSLLATIANKIETPLFYAQDALDAADIDVESMTYTRKPGQLSPLRLLQLVGSHSRMALELRTDEAGSIFLWCTTPQENTAWKKRFAHFRNP